MNQTEMAASTSEQYDQVIKKCKDVFLKKTKDYGTSWRILRQPSITDQIYIKAQRIRTIEEKGETKVDEGVDAEFIGIINYCIIALIQLELKNSDETELSVEKVEKLYDREISTTKSLMEAKNHDYGEAWRYMRVSSFTDMILVRLKRIKQIENNKGKTLASEGIDANFRDMINYAIFALIKMDEAHAHNR